MNILATMALRRALGRQNSVQSRAAAKVPVEVPAPDRARLHQVEAVVEGPINRVMYLEARSWAIDLVASLRGSPVDVVVERLLGAAAGRPGSYVAGIHSVAIELRSTDVTDRRENQNLLSQAGRQE